MVDPMNSLPNPSMGVRGSLGSPVIHGEILKKVVKEGQR